MYEQNQCQIRECFDTDVTDNAHAGVSAQVSLTSARYLSRFINS